MNDICSEVVCIAIGEQKCYISNEIFASALPHLPLLQAIWESLECKHCKGETPVPKTTDYVQWPIHQLPITEISLRCLQLCITHKSSPKTYVGLEDISEICVGLHYLNATFDTLEPSYCAIDWKGLGNLPESTCGSGPGISKHIRKILDVLGQSKRSPGWMWGELRNALTPEMTQEVYRDVCQQFRPIAWIFDTLPNPSPPPKKRGRTDLATVFDEVDRFLEPKKRSFSFPVIQKGGMIVPPKKTPES